MPLSKASRGDAILTGAPSTKTPPDIRLVNTVQNLEDGRFTGAIFADQTDNLALADGETDVVERLHPREGYRDALDFKHGFHVRLFHDVEPRAVERKRYSDDDQQPLHALLDIGRNPHEDHAVRQDRDDEHADHGIEDRSDATRKSGAADHDGGHRGEQSPLADQGVTLTELRDRHDAGQSVKQTGHRKVRMRVFSIGIPA